MKNNIILVGENKGFKVYFNSNNQEYTVFKNGKFLIGSKYKFSEVKSYLQ
jgi:hypothetical protein